MRIIPNGISVARMVVGLALSTFAANAYAQPEAGFEFEDMMGKFGFYRECPDTDTPNECFARPVNFVPPDGFISPAGADWLTTTTLMVADTGNNKLQICTVEGECQWMGFDAAFGLRNSAGTFTAPHHLAVLNPDYLAIADQGNHAVQGCTADNNCTFSGDDETFSNTGGSGLGEWQSPGDVAFDSSGTIFGLDSANNRIKKLSQGELNVARVYFSAGAGLGKITNAQGLAIDGQDQFVIADTGNHRIQICNTEQQCTAFGSMGSAVGQFDSPAGVDVDRLGRIWVADTGNHRIQVCDYQGSCQAFGSKSDIVGNAQENGGPDWVDTVDWTADPGKFNEPREVSVHPSGRVAVVDTQNHRIQFFRTESSCDGGLINAGLNDPWYNPATPGQGFFITVFPTLKKMFLALFTFDTERPAENVTAIFASSDQRWVTGLGDYCGDQAVVIAELSQGGILDAGTPAVTQTPNYGTFTLEFSDCSTGMVSYVFPDLDLSGVIPIVRLLPDNEVLCEALMEAAN